MSTTKPRGFSSWKSRFASRLAAKKITEEYEYFKALKGTDPPDLPKKPTKDIGTVCIVGAGVSGLYIAMILDKLNIPGLSYEIIEANDRFGGRVYTHKFSDAPHNYYDVGAMRFPEIDIMKKTFTLFEHLDMPLIPYFMEGNATPSRFNDITVIKSPTDPNIKPKLRDYWEDDVDEKDYKDPFKVSTNHGERIIPKCVEALTFFSLHVSISASSGTSLYMLAMLSHSLAWLRVSGSQDTNNNRLVNDHDRYVTEAFEPFKKRLRKNWSKGFEALMKYDIFSVRGFMMSHGITPLDDYFSIQWLETMTDRSGLYDQGFSEGVIDSLDFDYFTEYLRPDKKVNWKCIDGGTSLLTDAMRATLRTSQTDEQILGKQVTSIALRRVEAQGDVPASSAMDVTVRGEVKARNYAAVFNTTTLACLQRMDLTGLELLYEQKDAIRSLHYDTASKVGMKFKYPWWIKYGIDQGGLGKTDMPIRTCVYPSYNLDPKIDPRNKPSVLLVSYCWSQDAARIGSLMKEDQKDELKEVLFNNLAWLHLENAKKCKPEITFEKLYEEIATAYEDHHAFLWNFDPFTSGSYGKFGTGQFQNLYTALTCPTAGDRFYFVGALDSAHMTVISFLCGFGLLDKYWPMIGDPESGEYIDLLGPLPDECTRDTVEKHVSLGQLLPKDPMAARVAVEKEKTGADVKVNT